MTEDGTALAYVSSALVEVPADFAFRHLSDGAFVGRWSLGSMGLEPVGDGVHRGVSMFDGSIAHVEIRPDPDRSLIDFAVGSAETRVPRIHIRVAEGEPLGHGAGTSVVCLTALRAANLPAEAWHRTRRTHDCEILLIKAQLETLHRGAA